MFVWACKLIEPLDLFCQACQGFRSLIISEIILNWKPRCLHLNAIYSWSFVDRPLLEQKGDDVVTITGNHKKHKTPYRLMFSPII